MAKLLRTDRQADLIVIMKHQTKQEKNDKNLYAKGIKQCVIILFDKVTRVVVLYDFIPFIK